MRARRVSGFTLLELLVSMSLLMALGVLVLRLLTGGIDLWSRGEAVRSLLERSSAVADLVAQDLEQLAGTGEGVVAAGRLVDAPIQVPGLDGGPLRAVRFLRKLRPWEEARRAFRDDGRPEMGFEVPLEEESGTPQGGEEASDRGQPSAQLAGRALVLFFPFVSRHELEAPGVYLSLRRGEVRGSGVGPQHPWFGSRPFLGLAEMLEQTEEVLDGLLYFDLRYWAQATRTWQGVAMDGGPERAWDSTRGGATLGGEGPDFSLDLGSWSLEDPSDDLIPRLIWLDLVLDAPPGEARCAMLREGMDDKETGPLRVDYSERLGSDEGPGFFKIGGEWIRYTERRGEFVHGLERGVRGTTAARHRQGALLHVGWTVRRLLKPQQPREWWGPSASEPERGSR